MDGTIHTLQDFLIRTENWNYILIILILVGMVGFWRFLTARDED
jgi:hypothetical protein